MAGELRRHGLGTRLVHWTVAGSFALLVLTGAPLNTPQLFALTGLVGGGWAARALHPWVGLVFSAALAALVVGWLREMLPERSDGPWLRALGRYLAHAPDVPESGTFNAAQKLFFWGAAALGAVLLGSGAVLWRPDLAPRALIPWAAPVHAAAFFALGFAFVFHAYLSTAALPGTLRAMLSGTVTRAWADAHHRAWSRAQRDEPSDR